MLQRLRERKQALAHKAREIEQRDQAIKLKDAKIEKMTLGLARLKRWKFGAMAEAMSAEKRRLFEETCAEDEADLRAQLQALPGEEPPAGASVRRRAKLPDHLRARRASA